MPLLALSTQVFAQVNVVSYPYLNAIIRPENLFQVSVSNSGSPTQAVMEAWISASAGDRLLHVVSQPVDLHTGLNHFQGRSIARSSTVYGHSSQAQYVRTSGFLPSGLYTYCIVISIGGETIYEDCNDFEGNLNSLMILTWPADEDTIFTLNPVLSWFHTEPFNVLGKGESFTIALTELRDGESPEQAVAEHPQYHDPLLRSHQVPYPFDAKSLEHGKRYAWQVQKLSAGAVVDQTEVWVFTVWKEQDRPATKYAVLARKPDGGFHTVYDGMLYFTFEERYQVNAPEYKIFDDNGVEQQVVLKKDAPGNQEVLVETGSNRFNINLNEYGLKQGFYRLELKSSKGEKFYLKFYVEK